MKPHSTSLVWFVREAPSIKIEKPVRVKIPLRQENPEKGLEGFKPSGEA
jgi:hypothetical protein